MMQCFIDIYKTFIITLQIFVFGGSQTTNSMMNHTAMHRVDQECSEMTTAQVTGTRKMGGGEGGGGFSLGIQEAGWLQILLP